MALRERMLSPRFGGLGRLAVAVCGASKVHLFRTNTNIHVCFNRLTFANGKRDDTGGVILAARDGYALLFYGNR